MPPHYTLIGLALFLVTAPTNAQSVSLRFEQVRTNLPAAPNGTTGSAWMDFDGDGRVDLALPARDSFPSRVFRGMGNGRFDQVPLPQLTGFANAAAWGDVDGDGIPELVLAQNELVLLELRTENERPLFARVTDAGALTSPAGPRGALEAVAFGDIDADGDLDLIAGAHGGGGSWVLLNDGRGRFEMVQRDHIPFASFMGGAHLADLDGDRRPDLLFSGAPFPNFGIGTFVYWNEGSDTTDWTSDRRQAFSEHAGGLGSSLGDVDNDGDLDVFIAGWRRDTPSALYINEGERRFRRSGAVFPSRVIGSAFADIDNDGDVDLITSSGYSDTGSVEIHRNDGHGELTTLQVPGLSGIPGRYSGLTVVDVDADGRLDLFVTSRFDEVRLFRNVSPASSQWLQVELQGTRGGAPLWGTRVTLELETPAGARTLAATVQQQSGYAGHSEPVAHFGLPAGARVTRAVITWPNGRSTTLDSPTPGQRLRVDSPR